MKHKLLSLYVLILIMCSGFCDVSANDKEATVKSGEYVITFQEFADDYEKDHFITYNDGDVVYIRDIISDKNTSISRYDVYVKFESNETWAFYSNIMLGVWEGFEIGHEVVITLHVVEKDGKEYCEEIEPTTMDDTPPYRITNRGAVSHAPPVVTIISPNGDEDWSGNSNHTIIYNASGGAAPYTVKLYYTTDNGASFTFVDYHNQTMKGTYSYPWTTPLITNETVKIMVNVTDNASETGFDTSENFTIDSTPPEITGTSPANNSSAPLGSAIMIMFDEPVDNASVESAFSITPHVNGWRWEWISENNVMGIHDEAFEHNKHYICTVNTSAKDDSDPGNSMVSNYSWSFTAQPGIGDFNVTVDYPKDVEINKEYQVVVKIKNSEYAENRSGFLLITFYKKSENGTFTQIGEAQLVGGMLSGENATVYSPIFSFEETGNNYVKINVTSTNPLDRFGNETQYYEATYTVNVYPAPAGDEEKPIPWEQLENIRMLVIVIMVFLIIIFGYLLHLHRLHKQKKL
ncbi:MAG: Ig-like domain-containing protein [Thermoplasmatales archaeon]|nr:Ig-like domain-containing protein [Thermoplasmatales archaeon]